MTMSNDHWGHQVRIKKTQYRKNGHRHKRNAYDRTEKNWKDLAIR